MFLMGSVLTEFECMSTMSTGIGCRPRIMLPDVARQLYACGAKVSAVKTNIDGSHPGATKITPTSTPTSNSSLFDGIQSSTLIFGAVGIVMVFILLIAVIILCFKRRSRKYQYDSSSYLPTETSELDRGIRLFSIPAKEDQSDKYSSQLTNDYSSSVNDEVTVSQFNGTGSNGKTLTRTTEKRTASDSPFGDSTTLSKKETTDAGFSSTLSNVVSTPSVDSSMERIFFFSDIGHSNTFMNHVYTTFLPANVDNIACAPHIAYSTTEININIGDTLIVDKHLLEGWCIGKNMTQKTQGKFPVYCLTPITNIQLHFVQCFSEDTNRTMPKSVQNIRDWLVGIVFIHQLNLNQLKENEHYMYPIFGTLLGNEQCLVNGTMEFTDYMVSFLKTFGGSFWKDLDISTI
ncbi:hypothetical protein BC833DRAFT_569258 [Globomyces pollinis-pini]|nr:hypothetical protein BC833DRAFT_569258 [Globomyces pollinis-pini]